MIILLRIDIGNDQMEKNVQSYLKSIILFINTTAILKIVSWLSLTGPISKEDLYKTDNSKLIVEVHFSHSAKKLSSEK